MQLASIGLLVGVLLCQSLATLPSPGWCLLILIIIPVIVFLPAYRWLFCIALGFLYSVFIAHDKITDQISADLEGKDVVVTGIVASIPDKNHERSRFVFEMSDLSEFQDANHEGKELIKGDRPLAKRLRLSWYKTAPDIRAGQRWRLVVRLKRPRGFSNPGGFDYEAWLYQNDIHGTGYVRDNIATRQVNQLLGDSNNPLIKLHQLREYLTVQTSKLLSNHAQSSLISALLVGDRQQIDQEQWRVLTNTGTNHLMAISGLHIGLIAGLVFLLANRAWRFIPGAALYIAAPRFAAIVAIIAALFYAALAGFSLPTQRAVIMITIAMLAVWSQRTIVPSNVLAWALCAVLIYDPVAVITGSFWLSFGAVAIILYTMAGRLANNSWWWKWGRVQWVIAVGLFPVLLYWFQQVPLLAPIANFIAVPVVSLVSVPLSLIGGVLLIIWPGIAKGFLWLAAVSLDLLWPLLETMANLDRFIWKSSQPPVWALIPGLVGILYLLAPRGLPARWLGAVWLLPLVFYSRADIPHGAVRLTMLDVGHGLAVVVRTRQHVLLYDAGPRFSDQFDAGKLVVVPFLRSLGINSVDRVILSHNDIDHTGGFDFIQSQIPIANVVTGQDVSIRHPQQVMCKAGMQWEWDGVHFRIVHPAPGFSSESDNNMSCVVQITTESDKLLLTGDIERQVETQLVKFFANDDDNLRADVVLVPHHGSGSSSSARFVQAVSAKYALISVGYKNRYGLPKSQVIDRYQLSGATVMKTNTAGAITLQIGDGDIVEPIVNRQQNRRYWSNVNQ